MLTTSIIIFAIAAVFGLIVAAKIFAGKETPKPAVFLHGGAAAVALILLIVYTIQNPDNSPMISLLIFVVAALGGFLLFANDMRKKPGPKGLVVIHALAGVTAFILLLYFAFM